MFDCIYRDEVKQKIIERKKYLDDARIMNKGDAETLNQIEGFEKALNQIYCDIDDIRTAEQPVKHGKWEEEDIMPYDNFVVCSECGMNLSPQNYTKEEWQELFKYCPCCGARMGGESNG